MEADTERRESDLALSHGIDQVPRRTRYPWTVEMSGLQSDELPEGIGDRA